MWGSLLDKIQQLLDAKNEGNPDIVREYLDDRWSAVREVATFILADMGHRKDFDLLLAKISDTDLDVQLAAIYGIENMADWRDISIFKKLLKEKKLPEVRKALTTVIDNLDKTKS